MRGIGKKRLLVILLGLLSSCSPTGNTSDLFEALLGEEGMFARVYTIFSNDYFQYGFMLLVFTVIVSAVTRAAFMRGPLKNVVENERHIQVISLLIGLVASNGIFITLKWTGAGEAVQIMYGYLLTFLAGAVMIVGALWIFKAVTNFLARVFGGGP